MKIKTRKDLSEHFYKTLLSKDELHEDEQDEFDKKPKSVIVESNIKPKKFLERINCQVRSTEDEELFSLRSGEGMELFLDSADDRFWIFHSTESAKEFKNLVNSWIKERNSKLDHIWLPTNILENIVDLGKQTSFGLNFKNKFLGERKSERIEKVSMRFWGGPASDIYDELSDSKIEKAATLSRVGIEYSPTNKDKIKDSISYNGKFTIQKGNDISPHFNLLTRVRDIYSEKLENIEENYRMGYSRKESRISIDGNFLLLEFSNDLQYMEDFIETLTSYRAPFRIAGVWDWIGEDTIKANCVDLHTGDKLTIELTERWMRIYLEEGACGNVITRLFTNLQQTFDSQIVLRGEDDSKIM